MTTKSELYTLQSEYQLACLQKLQKSEWDRLKNEVPHIVKTMDWLDQQGSCENLSLLSQLMVAFADYCFANSLHQVLLRYLSDCLRGTQSQPELNARLLFIAYQANWNVGNWTEAVDYIAQNVKNTETLDPKMHAHALQLFGSAQINQGDYQNALITLKKAVSLAHKLGEKEIEIDAIREEAAYYLDKDDYDKAFTLYREVGDRELETSQEESVHTQLMLAILSRKSKHYSVARHYFKNLLQNHYADLSTTDKATVSHHYGWVLFDEKEYDQARELAEKALTIYQSTQNYRGISDVMEQLGEIAFFEKDLEEAEKNYLACASARLWLHNKPGYASITRRLSKLYFLKGSYWRGFRYLMISSYTYFRVGNLTPARMKRFFIDPWLKNLK